MNKKEIKPKVGQTIYLLFGDDSIHLAFVGFLGEKSFIVADYDDFYPNLSIEFLYEDYGVCWFFTRKEAALRIIANFEDKLKHWKEVAKQMEDWE